MKKLALISSLIALAGGLSAFGQGYAAVNLGEGKNVVWDGFTLASGVAATTANVDVALLWGPNGDVPQIDTAISAFSLKTGTNGQTGLTYTAAQAWSDILNDPNFTLAYASDNGGSPYTLATATTAGNGSSTFGEFDLNNSTGTALTGGAGVGNAYEFFFISWSSAYATPALAAAANSAVGWGSPFSYTTFNSSGTAATTSYSANAFGTFAPFAGVVPEPTTLALAGLGGFTLLFLRRKQ